MITGGYIKLHRKMVEWEWYQDPAVSRVFIHLLLTANHEAKQWKGRAVGRGQRIASCQTLAEELGLTKKTVYSALKKLEGTGEISCAPESKYTLITIHNFDGYQQLPMQNETQAQSKQITQTFTSSVIDDFNRICTSLPRVEIVTISHIHAISEARSTLGNIPFSELFERVEKSDYLTGKTDRQFKATLEWILRATNIEKIMTGKYDTTYQKGENQNGRVDSNRGNTRPEDFTASGGFRK